MTVLHTMYPVYLITCIHPKYGQHMMPYVGVVIGEGKTVEQRFQQHIKGEGHAPYLGNAIQKYGKEWFQVEQIDAGNTPEQALDLEKWWIKRLGVKKPNGYNLTNGGYGFAGWEPTPEQREKHREDCAVGGHLAGPANIRAALAKRWEPG